MAQVPFVPDIGNTLIASSPKRQGGACRPAFRLAVAAVVLLMFQGCTTVRERPAPLPEALSAQAQVPGIPRARYWGDLAPQGLSEWLALPDEALLKRYGGVMHRSHEYLVLSGGGSDGAFGAGLLVGWSDAGTRPDFELVTGISTGALIAPFAFLGTAYDERLREVYTRFSTKDLAVRRGVFEIMGGDAAMDTAPLRRLIAYYLDDAAIAAIAAEAGKGRSLLVGTTHLDAARPVIWDITAIAASGQPGAAELIRDVVLASASIPGAFPPVLLEVEAGGRRYTEMHVDGGVTAQLFLGAAGLDWKRIRERLHVEGPPTLYLVRNSRLGSDWQTVETRLSPIINRSISTLIRNQGIGDLARIYIEATRSGLGFNLARIPDDFDEMPGEPFDREYMRRLFARGYELGRGGYPWVTGPVEPAGQNRPQAPTRSPEAFDAGAAEPAPGHAH